MSVPTPVSPGRHGLPRLLEWAQEQPWWVRFAVGTRVVTGCALSEASLDSMASALVASAVDDRTLPLPPDTAGYDQGVPERDVALVAVCDLLSVNVLRDKERLEFEPTGLTIVYGDNASGKSGYSRVLRQLTRGSAPPPEVYGNAFDPEAGVPEATLEVTIEGVMHRVRWSAEQPPTLVDVSSGTLEDALGALAQVAVFDGACALTTLTQRRELTYVPLGLTVLHDVADQVSPAVRERLVAKRLLLMPSPPDVVALGIPAETEAASRVASLTARTELEGVRQFATLTEAETDQLATLTATMASTTDAELQRQQRIRAVRTEIRMLEEAIGDLDRISGAVGVEAQDSLLAQIRELLTNEVAARLAQQDPRDPLPGVGGGPWRALWDAARTYSTSDAYPAQHYPVTGTAAVCVLCQQPLAEHASERLLRFEAAVADVAATRSRVARDAVEQRREQLAGLQWAYVTALVREFRTGDDSRQSGLARQLDVALDEVQLRVQTMVGYCEGPAFVTDSSVSEGVEALLGARSAVAGALTEREVVLEALTEAVPQDDATIRALCDELRGRQALAAMMPTVDNYVAALRVVARLDAEIARLDTTACSLFAKRMAAELVTDDLTSRFSTELSQLTLTPPAQLETVAGRRGAVLHQMTLANSNAAVTDVLSDGEQRAVAFAGFFAELALAPTNSPVLLDDPVTSLDHLRRSAVAARLAQESLRRQVIVFTHDIAFLYRLLEAVEEQEGASCRVRRLEHGADVAGVVYEGLPWAGASVKERLEELEQRARQARESLEQQDRHAYEREVKLIYDDLRATYERAIEDLLFNGVVMRLQHEVKTQSLAQVEVTEADRVAVERGTSRISGLIAAHDRAAALAEPWPEVDEVLADIGACRAWVDAVSERRKRLGKERQARLKERKGGVISG